MISVEFGFISGAAIGILSFSACDKNMISENGLLDIGFNLFSLVVLLTVSFLIRRKQGRYQPFQIKRHMVLYFLGGIALSLYLTAVQFMGMGESHLVYGKDLVILQRVTAFFF